MAIFRYRKLITSRDAAAVHEVTVLLAAEARRTGKRVSNAGNQAEWEAPQAVDATEGTASTHELEAMLRSGQLQPSDLVQFDNSWTTFREHPAFAELSAGLIDTRGAGIFWRSAARVWVPPLVLVAALYSLVYALTCAR